MHSSIPRGAVICDISSQNRAHLAQHLLAKGYSFVGIARDAQISSFVNRDGLGISKQATLVPISINDFRSALQVLSCHELFEVYSLAGQSSVGLSFEQPVETLESIRVGTVYLLEATGFLNRNLRFHKTGFSECFGDTDDVLADETTPCCPRSPYAVTEATAFWQVANYCEAYCLFACSGILLNHVTPLRPERFVMQKIVLSACCIAAGSAERLQLGILDIKRDWAWTQEYVDAIWRMLRLAAPQDYVVSVGATSSLQDFDAEFFNALGLARSDHVEHDAAHMRSTDIRSSPANPELSVAKLNWMRQKIHD